MINPNVTLLLPEGGKDYEVLKCSVDATVCLESYKSCTEAGEVVYIRKGHIDKRKVNKAKAGKPKAEPKSKKA